MEHQSQLSGLLIPKNSPVNFLRGPVALQTIGWHLAESACTACPARSTHKLHIPTPNLSIIALPQNNTLGNQWESMSMDICDNTRLVLGSSSVN